jgi:FkbM family methyltransferase
VAPVSNAVRRIREIASLTAGVTRGVRARAALLSAYAGAMRNPNSRAECSFEITCNGARFPITIRHSDVFTLAEIFYDREYLIRSSVPAKPVVVDCGANVGLSPIWFLASFPGARVFAIEPEPDNLRLLTINVASRPDAVVTQAAVSKANGTVTLSVAEHGAMHSIKDVAVGQRTIDVPSVNLVDYFRQHHMDHVDILKLDIEGSELDAMESLGDFASRIGIVVGELHTSMVDEDHFYRLAESQGFHRVKREPARESGVHLFELARR